MAITLGHRLRRLRGLLIPEHLNLGWGPFYSLGYLLFLFMPAIFGGYESRWAEGVPYGSLGVTVLSVLVFLPLYFINFRLSGVRMVLCVLLIASLGYLLLPYNGFSNTYMIYAVAAAAFIHASLWQRLSLVCLLLATFLLEILLLGFPVFLFGITLIIALAVFFGSHYQIEHHRKAAALTAWPRPTTCGSTASPTSPSWRRTTSAPAPRGATRPSCGRTTRPPRAPGSTTRRSSCTRGCRPTWTSTSCSPSAATSRSRTPTARPS